MSSKINRKAGSRASADPVTRYAHRVSSGDSIAGPYVRLACERHLRDLKDGPKRGLFWDVEEVDKTFDFWTSVLRLNGGEFEGLPFELHESQEFIVGSIFGWKRANGYRRFRVVYIEEAKGNGKSPMVAGIGIKGLVADKEPRAEIYAAATKKDQAQILFRDAVAMVRLSPDLSTALELSGGIDKEWNIADLATASFFRCVASDDSQSGPRPHIALLDEVHEHKTGLMVEMMRAGFKGRRQPLMVMITNSGTSRTSICWTYHEYARKVNAGALLDDTFFGYVCALDAEDDPFKDEACWIKANPLLGIAIKPEYIREQITEARGMPSLESRVRRLNFCQWVESLNPWLSTEVWRAAEDKEYDDALLEGRECFGGWDLSSTTDLTAFVLLFVPTESDPHYRLKSWFWLPADNLAEKERTEGVFYGTWRAQGYLETTPGAAVNKTFVLARVIACAAKYRIKSIGFDEWRFEDIASLMADEGVTLPLAKFRQGYKSMAPAVDEFERLLISGDLKHDGNAVMNWNAASAVLETDPAGNRKATKRDSTGKIDGIVAAIMAAGRAISVEEKAVTPSFLIL